MKPKAEDSMSSVCGFFLQPYIYISLVFVMFMTKLLLIHDDVPVCMPIVSSYKCDDCRIVCKLVANTTRAKIWGLSMQFGNSTKCNLNSILIQETLPTTSQFICSE